VGKTAVPDAIDVDAVDVERQGLAFSSTTRGSSSAMTTSPVRASMATNLPS
jgi:hypothetical protein